MVFEGGRVSGLAGDGGDAAGRAFAAVVGEVGEQTLHLAKLDAVDQVAPMALLADQASAHELFEVERQRGIGQAQRLAQLSGRGAMLARHHQGAEHLQPAGLGQGRQGFDNVFLFHISIILEIYDRHMTGPPGTPRPGGCANGPTADACSDCAPPNGPWSKSQRHRACAANRACRKQKRARRRVVVRCMAEQQ